MKRTLERCTRRTVAVLAATLALMASAAAERWILPTDADWSPDVTTFAKMANDIEAAFRRAAEDGPQDVPAWDTYTIQYHGRFSDEGRRIVVVTGMCEASAKQASEHFDLTKVSVGIADGGVCIFSASYDADQQTLVDFRFHGEA